jgi:hypothetical protein
MEVKRFGLLGGIVGDLDTITVTIGPQDIVICVLAELGSQSIQIPQPRCCGVEAWHGCGLVEWRQRDLPILVLWWGNTPTSSPPKGQPCQETTLAVNQGVHRYKLEYCKMVGDP